MKSFTSKNAAANEVFKAGVKGLLVAYILIQPTLNTDPVRPFIESPLFVSLYLIAVVVIALYDIVAAALLMVMLTIWIIRHEHTSVASVGEQLQMHMNLFTEPPPPPPSTVAPVTAETNKVLQESLDTKVTCHDGMTAAASKYRPDVAASVRFVPNMPEAKYVNVQQNIDDIEDAVYSARNALLMLKPLDPNQSSAQGIDGAGIPVGANAYEPSLHDSVRPF